MTYFDLVTVRRYNGIEDGAYSWTFLTYAVLIKTEELKGVCLRNENMEYDYMPFPNRDVLLDAYESLNVGDIRVFPAYDREYNSMCIRTKNSLMQYICDSNLYFDDDTKYAKDISLIEEEKAKTKRKRIRMGVTK